MSFSVSDPELRRMIDLAQPTHDVPVDGELFDHGLLSRLAVAFDCVDVTFQESEPARELMISNSEGHQDGTITTFAEFAEESDRVSFWQAFWEDLYCCYPERTGDHESVTLYYDFHGDLGHQTSAMNELCDFMEVLMVPLPWSGDRDRRLLFWRVRGHRFHEGDRLLLTLLRPHLATILEAHDRAGQRLPSLTPREGELVILLASGLTNRQIGRELGIAEGTVRKHLEHVYARLGVTNRVAALAAYPDLPRAGRVRPAVRGHARAL